MSPKPKRRKPWAVLAYTVADDKSDGDSLDSAACEELKALCIAADFDRTVVAAQIDFKRAKGVFRGVLSEGPLKFSGSGSFEEIPAKAHRLWREIKAGVKHSRLIVLEDKTDLNAARASVLKNFLRFGEEQCPADRYVLFFYGHGYGPLGIFFDEDADETDRDTMALGGLADALETAGRRAAVIVFRACMANTLETAYQLKNAASCMIASQSLVPIAGIWPWANFLATLMPSAASHDVAASIARQLGFFLETPKNRDPFGDVPYSLIDLGAAKEIAKPLKALARALESARDDKRRARACIRALEGARVGFPADHAQPGDPALLDVPTMCENLAKIEGDPAAGPAKALGRIVGQRLVTWHHSQNGLHRGIALYYKPVRPENVDRSHIYDKDLAPRDDRRYRELALSKATGWDRLALNPLR